MNAQPDYYTQYYSDVVKLLQEKMRNNIRLNPRLRKHIGSKNKFVSVDEQEILFNFMEYSEAYLQKFVLPDFEKYCLKFMESFVPLLLEFLQEIHFSGYCFSFRFIYQKKTFSKSTTVLVKLEE
jgi:hypothetical protein